MYSLLVCSTCLIFLFVVLATGFVIFASVTQSKTLRSISAWFEIATVRTSTSIISACILLLISLYSDMFSLFATMSIMLFSLASIYVGIALIFKLYATFTATIYGQKSVIESQINNIELNENEDATVNIKSKLWIPWGYYLKIEEKLPHKLGSKLKGLSTSSKGDKSELEATIPYTKRGEFEIGPARLIFQDLFGFSKIRLEDNTKFKITILPEVPYISNYNFRLSYDQGDEDFNVKLLVNTDEYFGTREYIPGDDIRRMHWKLSAKTQNLVLRVPETTTINFKNISLIIFNILPRYNTQKYVNKQNKLVGPGLRFRNAVENALDLQINIASALIDFGLRSHIPIKVYYFDDLGMRVFTPHIEDMRAWKLKLARIKLLKRLPGMNGIDEILKNDNATIITTSETNTNILSDIIEQIHKHKAQAEIMYVPTSDSMQMINSRLGKKTESKLTSTLAKILLTKPYFEQNTIIEKLQNSFEHKIENYTDKEILAIQKAERTAQDFLHSQNIAYKPFYLQDRVGNMSEKIATILSQT